MATNMTQMPGVDTMAHFDGVAAQIEQTFCELINQLIARRDNLLGRVRQLREEFQDKEATRVAALEELEKTQLQLNRLSSKFNINLTLNAELTYQQAKEQLSSPTPPPNLSFSCPTLSLLQTQLSQFGELGELQVTDYSKKREPILTAGKEGLKGAGLELDERNQKVYIADYSNGKVQVLSFQGEFLSQFGSEILNRPWGVAVTNSHIFVTDFSQHKLFQFCKISQELIATAGGVGRDKGQLIRPHGLCVDRNGDVFIADTGNHRVSVFNEQLRFKSCLGEKYLSYPQDVQLTPDKMMVLDWSAKCLHFFSRSGDLLTSCASQGIGRDCLVNEAYFFCLDARRNFIVSDCDHHDIKIVSDSGKLLHTIGGKGREKGEFYRPVA